MSKLFGYMRKNYPVPINDQIKKLMLYNCESLFIEEEDSVADEFYEVLNQMNKEDCLVVYNMCVFDKTLLELDLIISNLASKKIRLISIEDDLDTNEDCSFFKVYRILKNTEAMIQQRRKDNALEEVVKKGRPRVPEKLVSQMKFLYFKKRLTFREVAEKCDLSLGTVHKYINEAMEEEGHVTNED